MESKVSYTVVGLFVVVLLALIVIIALWLSVGLERKNYKTYLVYMNESVAGLSENAPVKYNGVNVGSVDDISLNLTNPQQVIITLKIEPQIPVTTSTQAVLTEQGITGIAYIGLRGGNDAPLLTVEPGEKYPVIRSAPSFLVRLDTTLQKLTDNVDGLTDSVKELVSKKNVANVSDSLENIKAFTQTLADNDANIDHSLKDLKVLMENTSNASKDLPNVLKNIKSGAQSIRDLASKLNKTSTLLDKTLRHSDNAIQAVSNDIIPKTYNTLSNVEAASRSLKGLSKELNQNPSILIRGKTQAKPGPGE